MARKVHELADLELLSAFRPLVRDSDIFCSTTPKAGQTWLMALMFHLRSRGQDPTMSGRGMSAVMPWLEHPWDAARNELIFTMSYDRAARLAQLETLENPRIFKLHVPYEAIPRPAGSGSRVVTITRDLRDLPYSKYSHFKGLRVIPEDMTFEVFFPRWLAKTAAFDVIGSFWEHRDEPSLLWLRYEEMHADLAGQARRLAAFLGWPLDDADLQRVLPLVSLKHMQETEGQLHTEKNLRPEAWVEGARFFREGGIGKNRSKLSPEHEQLLLETARQRLGPGCFEFVMQHA